MALLYVGSVGSNSGKNLLCLGLGRRFLDDGLTVAFSKPYGGSPLLLDDAQTDAEAWMINNVLGLGQTPEQCCPVVHTQDLAAHTLRHQTGDLLGAIKANLETIGQGKDLVLLGGAGTLASGAACGVSGYSLVEELDAKVLLVDRYENDFYLDNLVDNARRLGGRLAGVVINAVDLEMNDALENQVMPFLAEEGVAVLGRIPTDDLLDAVSVGAVMELLGAQVLSGSQFQERLIKRFFIGAMQVRHVQKFFGGQRDFGCIVGGDRPDMQLAAIESGAACLILTGNFYPSDIIMSRAEEYEVPVMIVRSDTFSVAHQLEHIGRRVPLKEKPKIERGMELVGAGVDFAGLYEALGLKV